MNARTVLCLIVAAASAQTTSSPRFDVASIKPGADEFSTRPQRSGGRIRWTTQVCYLIGYAYKLDPSSLTGRNCGEIYSVEATFGPEATVDQVRAMIQSLLAERFGMRAHRVTTESEGYALIPGKKGLKVSPIPDDPDSDSFVAATRPAPGVVTFTAHHATIAQLAETLQRSLRTPVWDRTDLSGSFDFSFSCTLDLTADPIPGTPSLGTALQETLGLRLEKRKGPAETLVIDELHAPAEN